jgi:hypothetical protein
MRVIFYIDGFNLFFGLKANQDKSLYWLNVEKLAQLYMLPDEKLAAVKYFTAKVTTPEEKSKDKKYT